MQPGISDKRSAGSVSCHRTTSQGSSRRPQKSYGLSSAQTIAQVTVCGKHDCLSYLWPCPLHWTLFSCHLNFTSITLTTWLWRKFFVRLAQAQLEPQTAEFLMTTAFGNQPCSSFSAACQLLTCGVWHEICKTLNKTEVWKIQFPGALWARQECEWLEIYFYSLEDTN